MACARQTMAADEVALKELENRLRHSLRNSEESPW